MASWFWPAAAAALAAALIVVLVRPLEVPPDLGADDVALAWSESISRLGILPVFPPEEDLHVGDLWAVVGEGGEATPLLGKAVRLTHIDLRDEVRAARNRQPLFAETARPEDGMGFRRQANKEAAVTDPADPITLTLAAFPGISIRHAKRRTGSLTRSLGAFGAVRDEVETEEMRIPVAETYGVSAAAAAGRLDAWCSQPENGIYCSDDFVRRILAFAVTDRVLATRDGQYLYKLKLQLVTRVFLTREIEHRRAREGSGSAALRMLPEQGAPGPNLEARPAQGDAQAPAASEARARGALDASDTTARAATAGGGPAAAALLARADGMEIALRQVFQRPVVFGFRAVAVSLVPATPSKEPVP